jgi:cytochrome c551/c552
MRKLMLFLVLVLALGLVACGGEAAPTGGEGEAAAGNAAAGQGLLNQSLIGTQPGCMTCHSLEPGVTLVGPSLATVGAEAGSRVSGQSAEDYLRQSISQPNETLVEGYAAGIMPQGYSNELSDQQVNDLVAFLLTLK